MKAKNIYISIALSILCASCTEDVMDTIESEASAIVFGLPETRAVVDGAALPSGSSFNVWGGYDSNTVSVFNGETVSESEGTWSYTGNKRYWRVGKSHDFYAVYPAESAQFSDNKLTVSAFQCPTSVTDMANVTDLMTAYNKGMDGSDPKPVILTFKHALTRISLAVKLADDIPAGYKLTPQKLTFSAYTKGDMSYNLQSEEPIPAWSNQQDFRIFTFNTTDLNGGAITASGRPNTAVKVNKTDLFLVPQSIISGQNQDEQNQEVTLAYRLENNLTGEDYHYIDNEISVSLDKANIKTWNPGDALTYTLVVGRYNVTVVLHIGDWIDGNFGDQNVDFE